MKKSRLLEIIREEISAALNETTLLEASPEELKLKQLTIANKTAEMSELTKQMSLEKDPKVKAELQAKLAVVKSELAKAKEIKEDTLNEKPDFGGRFDQQVAKKYGEEDTLQQATDEIVDRVLRDRGLAKTDVAKMEKEDLKGLLKDIRQQISGKKQDIRVKHALEKQIEFDDSGSKLQDNQTNNAILKSLGLVTPNKRGRKADPNKPEKAPSTGQKGRPAGTQVATRTTGDDGFDDISYSDVDVDIDVEDEDTFDTEKAPAGDFEMERAARSRDELIKQYKTEVEPELKDKIARAKSGDTEAMGWLKSKQDIIKRYNQAKQINV